MPYTQSEVFRTAQRYRNGASGLGQGLPHGINQVCICCKAGSSDGGEVIGHVEKLRDAQDLMPWTEFFASGNYEFAAYRCGCGYQWSWYRQATPLISN